MICYFTLVVCLTYIMSIGIVIARMSTLESRCSVILTTHSMEEAEALCTRIGVSK